MPETVDVEALADLVLKALNLNQEPKTLYVHRKLKNGAELAGWAKRNGFRTTLKPEDMHATVCYSKAAVNWAKFKPDESDLTVKMSPGRQVEPLGKDGAVVLKFRSADLEKRHGEYRAGGASWDHPTYQPHTTLTYQGDGVDLAKVQPFDGDLVFGPEVFAEVKEDWADRIVEKLDQCTLGLRLTKRDEERRIAYGWFNVIEENGEPVTDAHGDQIDEETLLDMAHGFVSQSRVAKVMHRGRRVGEVIESMVFTKAVQQALGIDLGKVGWFGAMKFHGDQDWQDVKTGKLQGFSFGGYGRRKDVT